MFKNSCFISYRHLKDDYELPEFIRQFRKVLNAQLTAREKGDIFIDESRLKGGYILDETLSTELCKSCCMVMIFCPVYFDEENLYCTREFLSMQRLEVIRKKHLVSGKGLIIPVIYKDADYYYSKASIKGRIPYDFQGFGLWGGGSILESKDLYLKVKELADYIVKLLREFKLKDDVCNDCDKHVMVTEQEAIDWLQSEWSETVKKEGNHFPLR